MGNALPLPPPGFDGLSPEEKIKYVQALWDHISSDIEKVPLTQWQEQLLDERLEDLKRDPDGGISWSDVRSGMLRKLRKQ